MGKRRDEKKEIFIQDAKRNEEYPSSTVWRKAYDYMHAARQYVKAGEIKKAIRDYNRAYFGFVESYNQTGDDRFLKYRSECDRQIDRLVKVKKRRWHGLEGKAAVAAAIIGIVGGLFFLSSNITGNAIGSSTVSNSIGAIFLVVGLVAGFFWLKSKKK